MTLRAVLLLSALASPARAEVAVMSFEFPAETYVFPMDDLLEAAASPTLSGELGIVARFDANYPLTFGPFTARVVGQTGILRICGEEASRIVVQSQITSTSAMLALEVPEDAERLAGILNARSCDPAPGS